MFLCRADAAAGSFMCFSSRTSLSLSVSLTHSLTHFSSRPSLSLLLWYDLVAKVPGPGPEAATGWSRTHLLWVVGRVRRSSFFGPPSQVKINKILRSTLELTLDLPPIHCRSHHTPHTHTHTQAPTPTTLPKLHHPPPGPVYQHHTLPTTPPLANQKAQPLSTLPQHALPAATPCCPYFFHKSRCFLLLLLFFPSSRSSHKTPLHPRPKKLPPLCYLAFRFSTSGHLVEHKAQQPVNSYHNPHIRIYDT